jgi:hypothetical protein
MRDMGTGSQRLKDGEEAFHSFIPYKIMQDKAVRVYTRCWKSSTCIGVDIGTYITQIVKVGTVRLVPNQKSSPFIRTPMANW